MSVIGKPPKPVRSTVKIYSGARLAGCITVYADPQRVSSIIEKALKAKIK